MATTQTLTLTHNFKSDLAPVYTTVLDFHEFGRLHPVMISVKMLPINSTEFIEYAVEEELVMWGILLMKPKYNAKVLEVEKGKRVRYISEVNKGIFLTINFQFSYENGRTKVIEKIEVSGNKLITYFFLKILKRAHLKTFEKLNKELKVG